MALKPHRLDFSYSLCNQSQLANKMIKARSTHFAFRKKPGRGDCGAIITQPSMPKNAYMCKVIRFFFEQGGENW